MNTDKYPHLRKLVDISAYRGIRRIHLCDQIVNRCKPIFLDLITDKCLALFFQHLVPSCKLVCEL